MRIAPAFASTATKRSQSFGTKFLVHRRVSVRKVLFWSPNSLLLYGVGLLLQAPKPEYREGGPWWYTWFLTCCPTYALMTC